jgi:hypothetical protein
MKISKEIFNKIEFWIALFFIIRLIGITNPPIEPSHNWRQTTGLMVARNFYEIEPNILYPRLDCAGEKTGITGTEFPLFNYLIFLVSLICGYSHWYGRLISLIFSAIGTYFFYLIIRDYFDKKIAFYSTILLTCSLWFQYSRKTMPDIFSLAFVLAGVFYGLKYLVKKRSGMNLLIYAILILAGILTKIPSVYIIVIFTIPVLYIANSIKRKLFFILTNIIILIPVIAWYFYWVPYLNKTYEYIHYFMGVSFIQGFLEIMHRKSDTLRHFYEHAMMYTGFIIFIYGLIKSILDRKKMLLAIFSLCTLAFIILMFKMGENFPKHTYYVLIYIPAMALVAGYGIAYTNKKYVKLLMIVAVCSENILNQQHDFFINKEKKELMTLDTALAVNSKPTDLIVINCSPSPTAMYLSHRKGWLATNDELNNEAYIHSIRSLGCKYAVVVKKYLGEDTNLSYPLIYENNICKLYSLNN